MEVGASAAAAAAVALTAVVATTSRYPRLLLWQAWRGAPVDPLHCASRRHCSGDVLRPREAGAGTPHRRGRGGERRANFEF